MHVLTGSMFPMGASRSDWYWLPRWGWLFRRPYLVWLDRFWWLD